MIKKRNYLYVCAGIFILSIIINRRNINTFLANKSISWIDNMIDRQETTMFRSDRVDSLYVKKKYKYYLFTKGDLNGDDEVIQKLPYNSVLTIKPTGLSFAFDKEYVDTISLPASVVDMIIKKGEPLALFQILSAKKDSVGYLYRLKRISFYNSVGSPGLKFIIPDILAVRRIGYR